MDRSPGASSTTPEAPTPLDQQRPEVASKWDCRRRKQATAQGVHAGHPLSSTSRQQAQKQPIVPSGSGSKSQFSSFILFATVIVLINLCSFQSDFYDTPNDDERLHHASTQPPVGLQMDARLVNKHQTLPAFSSSVWWSDEHEWHAGQAQQDTRSTYLTYLTSSLEFVKLIFRQPVRLGKRTTRFTQAEARVLGKMAKVWYIKKKIKKLSKKLKKHTIAVPVFTAIPIYEHSYYPQPHITHVTHGGGMHHAAAASSYAPTVAHAAQLATAASSAGPLVAAPAPQTSAAAQHHQMVTSASNQHQVAAYRMAPPGGRGAMYHHPSGSHQIINAYAPSPPLFVDDTGGLYGHYGNAYGRYDGGYHVW